jgi:hypothetical protein
MNLAGVISKTAIVHTVTYFVTGFVAFTLLDYTERFADPAVAGFMRQGGDPWVASGPLFQVVRGALLGAAFYPVRELVFARKNGWLTLWSVLVVVGILAPFGAAPSSIEGMVYTTLPMSFHLMGLPEVLTQALLLAFASHYWVNHPGRKWLAWVFGVAFALVLVMSVLGVLAGLGAMP